MYTDVYTSLYLECLQMIILLAFEKLCLIQRCCRHLALQHNATHCNTLQHTATHCNKEVPSRRSLVSHYMGSQLAFCSWKETCNWRHPVHLEIHRIPSVARLLYWSLVSHYRCIGCLKLHMTFDERATKHRALLRKMTYKDKASYGSLPPCAMQDNAHTHTHTYTHTQRHAHTHP